MEAIKATALFLVITLNACIYVYGVICVWRKVDEIFSKEGE